MSKKPEVSRREFLKSGMTLATLSGIGPVALNQQATGTEPPAGLDASADGQPRGWVPQSYTVERDDAAGKLILSTRYYQVEHDLKRGGAISNIRYTHGQSRNLLLQPIGTQVHLKEENPSGRRDRQRQLSAYFRDLDDPSPSVSVGKSGKWEIVTVECALRNKEGRDSGIRTMTAYTYRWGYIKIHKEFHFPTQGLKVRGFSVFSTLFDPSLTHYGYKPSPFEIFSPNPVEWNETCWWGKMRAGTHFDTFYQTRHVPRYFVWANPGIEGIEWFMSDRLSQWYYQMAGQPGTGYVSVKSETVPRSVDVSIWPLDLSPRYDLPRGGFVTAKGTYVFDYYIGMPILEGHAHKPWFERSFAAKRGEWVSEDEVKRNAELGVETMTLHDDGDYNDDGLYWRDGSWPPYPPDQMKKMGEVIGYCHKYGIKTVPYFSSHGLDGSTPVFKNHGEEWGAKLDDQGTVYPVWEPAMCLRSGWLDYMKSYVDLVLRSYPFDGVYFDQNVPIYCNNPLHVGERSNGVSGTKGLGTYALSATGHWDVDELLEWVEWTRERVGPDGLFLVHDTMSPIMAVENFANAVCNMEFNFGQLSISMPRPEELPLEWNFAGARSRADIEYGRIARNATEGVRKLFYLTALMTGVATWPASDGVLELFKILKPLGDLTRYQFEDWRNKAVALDRPEYLSAIYSRADEAYVLVANLGTERRDVNCKVNPDVLKNPLATLTTAEIVNQDDPKPLNAAQLARRGVRITVPAAGVVLLHLR